jgi:Flp pilus assembly protein TadG
MVYLSLRDLEGKVAMKHKRNERGQSVLLFAILMPVMSLFLLGILDYMVTNARVMETVAVADLAAHAGAQEITVLPDGTITATAGGHGIAATYFNAQRPGYAQLAAVSCGRHQGRPACFVTAQTRSAGYLLPARWVTVRAIGYLAHGVTRGDQ